jgi:sarcosine oxidase subunit delta
MQRFPCPFCGLRDEREFRFGGEAGKTRPETDRTETAQAGSGQPAAAPPGSAGDWAAYLYRQENPMGAAREIWVHLPCQEYFIMERDTVTMQVLGTTQLREGEA